MALQILQRQLRWLGHVIRLPTSRLPRRILYRDTRVDNVPEVAKKCYSIHIKNTLTKCEIPADQLEVLAGDRDVRA